MEQRSSKGGIEYRTTEAGLAAIVRPRLKQTMQGPQRVPEQKRL
jgi:hypothetical protein